MAPRAWGPMAGWPRRDSATRPVVTNADVRKVRKVKSQVGPAGRGHNREWCRLGSWEAHSLRSNLNLAQPTIITWECSSGC